MLTQQAAGVKPGLTAETMYQGFTGDAVKSAGTEPGARIRVNQGHIGWADMIFVMET
jgi:predicted protein tyrosine phosphatase